MRLFRATTIGVAVFLLALLFSFPGADINYSFIEPESKLGSFLLSGNISGCGMIDGNATLISDIQYNETCFTVNTSGVIFDGGDYRIIGGNGSAIQIVDADNVNIRNFNIETSMGSGISVSGSDNTNIQNNTITTLGDESHAIQSINSRSLLILRGNVVSIQGSSSGFYLSDSSGLIAENNEITTNHDNAIGIHLIRGTDSTLSGNTITTTNLNSAGILAESATTLGIMENTITTSGSFSHSIDILSSSDLTVELNQIGTSGYSSKGILVRSSSNIDLVSNTITTSGVAASGISIISGSNDVTVSGNTIHTSNADSRGIHAYLSRNVIAESNTITTESTGAYGIYSASDEGTPENERTSILIKGNIINSRSFGNAAVYSLYSASGGFAATENTIEATEGSKGIQIFNSNNIALGNNTVVGSNVNNDSSAFGIRVISSDDFVFSDNDVVVTGIDGAGIFLQSSSNGIINNPSVRSLGDVYPLFIITGSSNNLIRNGILNASGYLTNSVMIQRSNNTRFESVFLDSGDWEIKAIEAYGIRGSDIQLKTAVLDIEADNIAISHTFQPAALPPGKRHTNKFFNLTNTRLDSRAMVFVHYSDSDIGSLDEESLRMWRYDEISWTQDGFYNDGQSGVDTVGNLVFANITSWGTYAPLGNPAVDRPAVENETLNISFVSPTPTDNSSSSSQSHIIKVSVRPSANIDQIILEWMNSTNTTNLTMTETVDGENIFGEYSHTALSEDVYQYKVWAVSSSGSSYQSETRTLVIDRTPASLLNIEARPPEVSPLDLVAINSSTNSSLSPMKIICSISNGYGNCSSGFVAQNPSCTLRISNLTPAGSTEINCVIEEATGLRSHSVSTLVTVTGDDGEPICIPAEPSCQQNQEAVPNLDMFGCIVSYNCVDVETPDDNNPPQTCPATCPSPEEFGGCENGLQYRTNYVCSETTAYQCQPYQESSECDIPVAQPNSSSLFNLLPAAFTNTIGNFGSVFCSAVPIGEIFSMSGCVFLLMMMIIILLLVIAMILLTSRRRGLRPKKEYKDSEEKSSGRFGFLSRNRKTDIAPMPQMPVQSKQPKSPEPAKPAVQLTKTSEILPPKQLPAEPLLEQKTFTRKAPFGRNDTTLPKKIERSNIDSVCSVCGKLLSIIHWCDCCENSICFDHIVTKGANNYCTYCDQDIKNGLPKDQHRQH